MLRFEELEPLLGRRAVVDVPCPACSASRKPAHRQLPVLRIWAVDEGMVSFYCAHCEESGYARSDDDDRGDPKTRERERTLAQRQFKRAQNEAEELRLRIDRARALWHEGVAIKGTWAERYLIDRGLDPKGAEGLRFHRACPFPDQKTMPALLVAFTAFSDLVEANPLVDIEPTAIHRIRGRGHENKAMLGPVGGAAMMLDAPHLITSALSVTEGVETGIAVRKWSHYPVWALGSAGAFEKLPVIKRVRRLMIWADADRVGQEAAKALGRKYSEAGRNVTIRWPGEGSDYAG